MSRNIWVISDTHFNHANILTFKGTDGKLIRPDFDSVEDMNETMIDRWNSVVKEGDKVYHLGDVYMGSQNDAETVLSRLNGTKRLIVGNHDVIYGKGNPLQKFFKKIYLWRSFKELGLLLTHVPVHPDHIGSDRVNVHGHIHEKTVTLGDSIDQRYHCVCVEHTNYTPVNIDELRVK